LLTFSVTAHAQYTLTIDDVTFVDGEITDYLNTDEIDVIIPDNFDGVAVTSIGDNAFGSEESRSDIFNELRSVTIPNYVTSIGYSSFIF